MATASLSQQSSDSRLSNKARKRINSVLVTLITAIILIVFLLPLAYGVMTSLISESLVSSGGARCFRACLAVLSYDG